jgi:hypothetical protein
MVNFVKQIRGKPVELHLEHRSDGRVDVVATDGNLDHTCVVLTFAPEGYVRCNSDKNIETLGFQNDGRDEIKVVAADDDDPEEE